MTTFLAAVFSFRSFLSLAANLASSKSFSTIFAYFALSNFACGYARLTALNPSAWFVVTRTCGANTSRLASSSWIDLLKAQNITEPLSLGRRKMCTLRERTSAPPPNPASPAQPGSSKGHKLRETAGERMCTLREITLVQPPQPAFPSCRSPPWHLSCRDRSPLRPTPRSSPGSATARTREQCSTRAPLRSPRSKLVCADSIPSPHRDEAEQATTSQAWQTRQINFKTAKPCFSPIDMYESSHRYVCTYESSHMLSESAIN